MAGIWEEAARQRSGVGLDGAQRQGGRKVFGCVQCLEEIKFGSRVIYRCGFGALNSYKARLKSHLNVDISSGAIEKTLSMTIYYNIFSQARL